MRINVYIAKATGLSRRAADQAILEGRATVDGKPAAPGDQIHEDQRVILDGTSLALPQQTITILLNKPVGYVVSRNGQGSRTIYDLLPPEYQSLKPVGRLDKDSSGLLLLTNDGHLANQLTHPRHTKTKVYEVELNKPLSDNDHQKIEQGVLLEDGSSTLALTPLSENGKSWQVSMSEGRNRQIRRTFSTCGYSVIRLHRTRFGEYDLGSLKSGSYHQNPGQN